MFSEAALSQDGFLDGRLRIRQPKAGYRAGIDPVLLAAAVPAQTGQQVLELGIGAGVASLCLGVRVSGLVLAGVELQPDYAELAVRNARENGLVLEVAVADLCAMPSGLTERAFDHVLANPPYFHPVGRSPAPDAGREAARAGVGELGDWIRVGLKRLRPGGTLTLIQLTDRLPEILAHLPAGGVVVRPVASRLGRAPERVIVSARKGARAGFRLLAPLILHEGSTHSGDRVDYLPWAQDCLRNGAPLPDPA
jgi:tRNA1(Val) A37 N6-methylase TrmN6